MQSDELLSMVWLNPVATIKDGFDVLVDRDGWVDERSSLVLVIQWTNNFIEID